MVPALARWRWPLSPAPRVTSQDIYQHTAGLHQAPEREQADTRAWSDPATSPDSTAPHEIFQAPHNQTSG